MSDDQLMKQNILKQLNRCGVPVSKLHLSVDQEQIEVSGSVDTFYSLQLIQSHLRSVVGRRKLLQNVYVRLARESTGCRICRPDRRYQLGLDA